MSPTKRDTLESYVSQLQAAFDDYVKLLQANNCPFRPPSHRAPIQKLLQMLRKYQGGKDRAATLVALEFGLLLLADAYSHFHEVLGWFIDLMEKKERRLLKKIQRMEETHTALLEENTALKTEIAKLQDVRERKERMQKAKQDVGAQEETSAILLQTMDTEMGLAPEEDDSSE